jgi:hypothetical protein
VTYIAGHGGLSIVFWVEILFATRGPGRRRSAQEAPCTQRRNHGNDASLPDRCRTAAHRHKDFVFEGHQIYEGEMIYVGTSVPHFMEEYWPNAKTFDIDRYRKPRAEHLQSGVYSPYGRGPHTCLGKSLAEVQMALTMARVFHKLDLELNHATTCSRPRPRLRLVPR